MQNICFRKTSNSNVGALNLLLAPWGQLTLRPSFQWAAYALMSAGHNLHTAESVNDDPVTTSIRSSVKGLVSGVFKGRRARHLPRAPSFWGPPLTYYAHKFSLFLVKDVLFTHIMCYKADHKQVFCFQRAPTEIVMCRYFAFKGAPTATEICMNSAVKLHRRGP